MNMIRRLRKDEVFQVLTFRIFRSWPRSVLSVLTFSLHRTRTLLLIHFFLSLDNLPLYVCASTVEKMNVLRNFPRLKISPEWTGLVSKKKKKKALLSHMTIKRYISVEKRIHSIICFVSYIPL